MTATVLDSDQAIVEAAVAETEALKADTGSVATDVRYQPRAYTQGGGVD